jgi:hypothetical protein
VEQRNPFEQIPNFDRVGRRHWIVENTAGNIEHHDWQEYREFWGDEFRWTSLLPFAWSMIDYPGFEIHPENFVPKDPEAADRSKPPLDGSVALWSAVIHLLGLGMGWTYLSEGLELWKKERYQTGFHPILDLVKRLCGEHLDALLLHLQLNSEQYLHTLSSLSVPRRQADPRRLMPVVGEEEAASAAAQFAPLGRELLVGGYDPLHLSLHFDHSVNGHGDIMQRNSLIQLGSHHYVLLLDRYAQWGHALANCDAQRLDTDGEEAEVLVEVRIKNLGSLGQFAGPGMALGGGSRWFRVDEQYSGGLMPQYESYAWGG